MPNINKNSSAVSEDELLRIPRVEVPESRLLSQSIIKQTSTLEQDELKPTSTSKKRRFSSWLMPLTSMAMAGLMLAVMLVLLPNQAVLDDTDLTANQDTLSAAELEFQDSLLFQDELLFADL